jgi:hypothetical protein
MADADILLVACVFGKGNGVLIQNFQEARRPTPVLDVGLAVGACSR